ncbi:MAG: hypothetical protein ACKORE_02830 [Bacteroidota bacterium]
MQYIIHFRRLVLVSIILSIGSSCGSPSEHREEKTLVLEKNSTAIADTNVAIVDSMYAGIARGDSALVVGLFHSEGRLLGSDPAEDWSFEGIQAYMSERSAKQGSPARIEVVERRVSIRNTHMLVTDRLKISTVSLPFRCVTEVDTDDQGRKIHMAEFSALIRNDDLSMLDSLLNQKTGSSAR